MKLTKLDNYIHGKGVTFLEQGMEVNINKDVIITR